MSTPARPMRPTWIDYPDTDGQPMAENTVQYQWLTMIKEGLNAVRHFVGDRLTKGVKSTDDITPGEGKIVLAEGEQLAVYKDEQGALHAVSAVCTHMGCILGWNSAEKSWDCPCHGSRFGIDGRVLHGPAVVDLEHKDIPDEQ